MLPDWHVFAFSETMREGDKSWRSTHKNAREEVLPQEFAVSNGKARDKTDILSLHIQSGEF